MLCRCLFLAFSVALTTLPDFVSCGDQYMNDTEILKHRSCIENLKKSYPHLADLPVIRLAHSCKRWTDWHRDVDLSSNITSKVSNYTKKQKAFIDRICYCRDYQDCYNDVIPRRHQRLKRQSGSPPIRRECRSLTRNQLRNYFRTINRLKRSFIDGTSKYDLIIAYHLPESAPGAHFGPAFLPYHRELLKQMEVAGRRENPSFALCYWDSTLDYDLPNAAHSILWSRWFFGSGDGYVTDGPFANWATTSTIPVATNRRLFRLVGRSSAAGLYNWNDINRLLGRSSYTELCSYCVDPTFELLHAGGHDFVGGYMTYISVSPNDPVFFNHHCFIDRLWEDWRQTKQSQRQRESQYPNDNQACSSAHYGRSPMRPFNIRNLQGLSESYMSLYTYADSPSCDNDCSGVYLFCNTNTNSCMSKVRPGGNCRGLEGFDSCYNSQCSNGVCS